MLHYFAGILALAVEHGARLAIIDEVKGRQYARHLGIPLTGTLGVLLLAKEEGLISAVAPLVNQLEENGLFLAPKLISKVVTLAQEDE